IMAFFSIKNFLKRSAFDIVHTHSSKAGIIGRAAAKAAKIPVIVHTIHGQAFHRYEKPWKNWLYKTAERWAAKRSDKIFAVCQAMIDQALEAGIADPSKYKVVFSGMELEKFLTSSPDIELRKQLGIPDGAPVVGSIARLFPLKGYEYFLPAAEIITSEFPDAFFLVVGDGILTETIKAEAKRKKLNFVFAGLVPPDQIWRYCSIMDVLMHLSLREGLPRAVVQALASGKPAVGFSLDGTPEVIIPGKTGFLAEPKNAKSAAEQVIKLLQNPELADTLGENGRKLAIKYFDWQKMCDVLEDEYLKLINN
ncbi:MAG: glycosyltransferase family 4 protein, partial [Candidatus Nanoarchaeia archaeon]